MCTHLQCVSAVKFRSTFIYWRDLYNQPFTPYSAYKGLAENAIRSLWRHLKFLLHSVELAYLRTSIHSLWVMYYEISTLVRNCMLTNSQHIGKPLLDFRENWHTGQGVLLSKKSIVQTNHAVQRAKVQLFFYSIKCQVKYGNVLSTEVVLAIGTYHWHYNKRYIYSIIVYYFSLHVWFNKVRSVTKS